MLELREELDDSVQRPEFVRAGELKEQLAQLEAEKERVLEEMQPVVEEVREEKVSLGFQFGENVFKFDDLFRN
jgi:hypothetical protein